MSGELAITRSARPMLTAEILNEEADQRKLLMQYVESQMKVDTDYGVIPGTKNRTLLKPGAEKLTDLFRCVPEFTILEKIEDWDKGLFNYQFKCTIVVRETGMIVAEGFGSCSTWESKYRWRNSERKCPNCGKAAIIKGKAEYGGGWLCWSKKDGCNYKFTENDPVITEQVVEKVQNPDIHDAVNTVLKMAKKRAHVDAAISLARCSDMFTQDAEELHHQESDASMERRTAAKQAEQKKGEPKKSESKKTDSKQSDHDKLPMLTIDGLIEKVKEAKIERGEVFEKWMARIRDILPTLIEPISSEDPTLYDYVAASCGLGDQQEWHQIGGAQLITAKAAIVEWLKHRTPKKTDADKEIAF